MKKRSKKLLFAGIVLEVCGILPLFLLIAALLVESAYVERIAYFAIATPICTFVGLVLIIRYILQGARERSFALLDRMATHGGEAVECPSCHTLNEPNAMFCEKCRATLAKRCNNCGARLPSDAMFCNRCGAPLDGPDARG